MAHRDRRPARPLRGAESRTARRRAGAAAVIVGLLAPVVLTASAAAAQDAVVVHDPRLHPSLGGVVVTGEGRSSYTSAYRDALGRHGEASSHLVDVRGAQEGAAARDVELRESLARTEAERDRAEEEADRRRTTLREIGVASYTSGSSELATLDQERADTEARQRSMVSTVTDRQAARYREAVAAVAETTERIGADTTELESLTVRIEELAQERTAAEQALLDARGDVTRSRASLSDWRLGADVAGSDIPLVALDAYVRAAERLAAEQPACGLRWWGLAGIGKVESGHGTFAGTRPGPDGRPLRRITGIPLDGNNDTVHIPDSDGGLLDGDTEFDRAVGPMQFIPGTWGTQGRDGDGDGRADVHDLHDAALAAATYLCRAGGSGLDGPEGLRRASLTYNNSGAYADEVVRLGLAYASREADLIPPPPPAPVDPLTTDALSPPPPEQAPQAPSDADDPPAPPPAPDPGRSTEPGPTATSAAPPAPPEA